MVVGWHKNFRGNVEKIAAILASFQRKGSNLLLNLHLLIETIYHRLTAFIVPRFECTMLHGVDIFQ
jgi:hypothetical protein